MQRTTSPRPSLSYTGAATSTASKCSRPTNGSRLRCAAPGHGPERGMDSAEREEIAQRFGVAPEQVERDPLISHLLAFLSDNFGERIQFIGGTALARTHLSDGRLSEDVDLIALDDRSAVAADLDAALPRALARTHGRLTIDPSLTGVADVDAAILRSAGGISVRIQLLSARDRVLWPTERRNLEQRYHDAPAAQLI